MRRRARARGFTLIELVIAFGVSVTMLTAVYFYYFGVLGTWARGQERETLNEQANTALERMVRELRMAQEVLSIAPHEIAFKKFAVASASEEEAREYTGERPQLETIKYSLVKKEGSALVERQTNLDKPERILRADQCEPEIFTGWVLEDCDPEKKECPRYHQFDFTQQIGSDNARIVLVEIRFKLTNTKDALEIRTRVSLPAVHARLMQPGWNTGQQP